MHKWQKRSKDEIMKEISFEERRQIQLDMLIEIDEFCRNNNIRYTLAYGTLIGAIRHKGFIPWDDDVDIMMPLPDMLRFKEVFKSDSMCYCDVDTDKNYQFAFSRIAHTKTYNKDGLIAKSYGVNIDLYPVLGLPNSLKKVDCFFNEAKMVLSKRMNYLNLKKRIVKFLPLKTIPGFNKVMRQYRDFLFQYPFENTKYFFTYGGGLHMRNVVDYDLFDQMTIVSFEGHKFMATAHYDKYLRHFYGDYMQLPPIEQRVPYHGGKYFWKN